MCATSTVVLQDVLGVASGEFDGSVKLDDDYPSVASC